MNRTLSATLALSAALALAGGALALSCKRGQKPVQALASRPTPPAVDPLALAIARDGRYQPDVKMLAYAQGETVFVQLQSATDTPIRVEARNFGVIVEGERKVHPFDPSIHSARFPQVGLQRGELASGVLQFTGLGDLTGQRLVFNHAHTRPSVALIQGEGEEQPAVPRPTPRPASAPAPALAPSAPAASPKPSAGPVAGPPQAAPRATALPTALAPSALAIPTPYPDVLPPSANQ